MQKTLVRGAIWSPVSPTQWWYEQDGALIIDTAGRIAYCGRFHEGLLDASISAMLDYTGHLILPGLVDTHIHLPQLPIRGIQSGDLLTWLEGYALPIEEKFADLEYAKQLSQLFFNLLKANGTTTALVYASVHEASTHVAFQAAAESGLRIAMGKVMMDQNVPDSMKEETDASIQSVQRLAAQWHRQNNDLLYYAFTPRFALSCSEGLLKACGELWKDFPGSYLQSHLSENRAEVNQIQALYNNRYTYTEIYDRFGCLGPQTVMAHGIHLKDSECELLRHRQSGIAHCPSSNFFLHSGFFNLGKIQSYDIKLGLGTDVGAGPDISLFPVMRAMDMIQMEHQRRVRPTEALYYATLGGAKLLSLEAETGNLEAGKSADFIVVDLSAIQEDWMNIGIEDHLSKLIYAASPPTIKATYVRGRQVYTKTAL